MHFATNDRTCYSPLIWAGILVWLLAPSGATAQSLSEQGFRIMNAGNTGNCIACHALPGQTGLVSSFGPTLDKVASRYTPEELRQWVSDARKIKPNTLMPPFGTTQGTNASVRAQSILSDEQIAHVVAALLTLK
jgi:L-cysteine S-thiosulfotransferase